METPNAPVAPRPKRRFLAGLLTGGLVGALLAGGASFAAHAQDGGRWCMSRMHHGGAAMDPQAMRERVEFGTDWVLRKLDATEAQKQDVKRIVFAALDDLKGLPERHRANRDALREALTAESVDAARLETLRRDELALADEASRRITQAVVEASKVLTPEQRRRLADLMDRMRGPGGPMGGGPGPRPVRL